jgi:hypothetical protein
MDGHGPSKRQRIAEARVASLLSLGPGQTPPGVRGYDDDATRVAQKTSAALDALQVGLGIMLAKLATDFNHCFRHPDGRALVGIRVPGEDGTSTTIDTTSATFARILDQDLRWKLICEATTTGMPRVPNIALFVAAVTFLKAVKNAEKIMKRNERIQEIRRSAAEAAVQDLF